MQGVPINFYKWPTLSPGWSFLSQTHPINLFHELQSQLSRLIPQIILQSTKMAFEIFCNTFQETPLQRAPSQKSSILSPHTPSGRLYFRPHIRICILAIPATVVPISGLHNLNENCPNIWNLAQVACWLCTKCIWLYPSANIDNHVIVGPALSSIVILQLSESMEGAKRRIFSGCENSKV